MTAFIGIYKAVFQYTPQSEEELAIEEDDLLYLLQKSDVDDWWTVKKRVIGSDAEEPVGLVPNNYIEEAQPLYEARALYDYPEVQNAEEEISFSENDVFDVFDDRDADWILCRSQRSGECGFVPGNYIERSDSSKSVDPSANSAAAAVSMPDPSSFPPPPQRISRPAEPNPNVSKELPSPPESPQDEQPPPRPARPDQDDQEYAPPRPSRPSESTHTTTASAYAQNYNDDGESDGYGDYGAEENGTKESRSAAFSTWDVSEVDGRKKRKAKIAISKDTLYYTPSKGTPQQWPIQDLMTYDNEKKHIFFEFTNPYLNLEIHTGTTDVANEIMAVLGEVKGAYHASGLREVEAASKASAKKSSSKDSSKNSNRKQGKVVYDFIGESNDELTVKEGQIVHILDDKKSRDWWICEVPETGRKGVVPAQFIEPINQLSFMASSLKSMGNFSKSSTSISNKDWKKDDDQDVRKKSSTRKRASSFLHKKKDNERSSSHKKHKDFPDAKKTRIWVDRSGTFKVEAEFIGCVEGKIHLHKANGVKIAVAADKLCQEDLELVERLTGTSLDKYKPKAASSESSSARSKERERRKRIKEQEEREQEREQRERDRRLREQELLELRKARELLDEERENLRASKEKELPPIKPPRPTSTTAGSSDRKISNAAPKPVDYDWFEFFLNCGVDVSNCQRYTINFEREQISEETLPDVQPSILRTLGLREGDIIRVMKYLDQKYGRENTSVPSTSGGLFSEPDGSLKVSQTGVGTQKTGSLPEKLLPQQPAASGLQVSGAQDDDAWTVRPAAKSEATLPHQTSEFTGSMQDLLDLQPLEPKKTASSVPQPNIKDLEPVKTGSSRNGASLQQDKTGASLAPLDPFKTGGHNMLPMATGGFVMVPVSTGGLVPLQRTGGVFMPQTTFGLQPTGTILPVQKTGNGLVPVNTGGLLPQTTFGLQGTTGSMSLQRTGGLLPLQQTQLTGSILPQMTSGGLTGPQSTGGAFSVPQTSFGTQGLNNTTPMPLIGGTVPLQRTGGMAPNGMQGFGLQSVVPQTSFGGQATGVMNMPSHTGLGNNYTGGANMMPATSFNNNMTGGPNLMPATSFGGQMTGGMPMMPQQTFNMPQNNTAGYNGMSQTTFNAGVMPQNTFNTAGGLSSQMTSGMMPTFGPQRTGGFQPQSQFGLNLQRTGGVSSMPQSTFNTGGAIQSHMGGAHTGGINDLNNMFQNTSISQPALQSQPTGFGFGNGPQPQQRQANIFNASADNPFGF